MTPYLVAEIGINHNGDIQIAKRLIDAAFAIGWDCVKFQKRTPDVCVPDAQKGIMKDTPWGRMTYLDYKKRIEFSYNDYDRIDAYCNQKPIQWTASVWDIQSLSFMSNFRIPFIKIPSAKITDLALVSSAAATGIKIVLSTGMSTLEQIDRAVMEIDRHKTEFVLMHANSAYPAPDDELNLNLIRELQKRYGCQVGYSGHEQGLMPSVIAATMGAVMIERHVTLSHDMWGTDQKASLEIHAMDMLKKRIDEALRSMGDGVKRVTDKEQEVLKKLRG